MVTDEDIEYICLFALMGETTLDVAINAMFDLKGVDDPYERDAVARYELVYSRTIDWLRDHVFQKSS